MDDPCMKLNFALLADLPEAASLLSSSFPMAESATTQRELDEFRRQWREEVESRKAQLQQKVKSPPVRHDVQEDPALSQQLESLSLQEPDEVVETKTEEGLHSAATAMDHYIAAVDNERQGKLGQALASYRRAFKLDPDIDHAYKRHYQAQLAAGAVLDGSSGGMPLVQKPVQDEDTFQHVVPVGNEYVAPAAIRKDPLEDLIREFSSQHIEYIPAVDYKPVLISKLPSEIIIHILRHLILSSVSSVANFALACKNFFLLTRSPSLWRFACEHTFRQPYMSVAESRLHQSHHVKAYGGHWMRMFIERPRIRYDGIYISTCHYIRPGSSENTWNQPVHLVTYYRYLRFFPDGTILKYLSTDEPAHVVKLLTPEFSRRQVFRGHFEQREGHVYIEMIDRSRPREHFRMTLTIKSTHRGRHNKLAWIEYASATQGLETETLYDLKLMKPYFFSVVRSYKVDTPSPLDHLEDSY